jgi:hypothetical protein
MISTSQRNVPFRHINNAISLLIKLLFKGQTREISTIKNKGGEDRSNYYQNTAVNCKAGENQEDNFGCARGNRPAAGKDSL